MKWSYSFDNENWHDIYDTRNEAIKEAIKDIKTHKIQDGLLTIGAAYQYKVQIDECMVIENIQDDAADFCGEWSEEYLRDVTKEEKEDLRKLLQEAYEKWMKKYPKHRPNFYSVSECADFPIKDVIENEWRFE